MDINIVKGVGPKVLEYFNNKDIYTINDLLEYYPYRYNIIKLINIREIPDSDTVVTIKGIIDTEPRVSYIKKLNKMTFRLNSDGILVNVTIFNRAFYKNNLKIGRVINVIGKYDKLKNSFIASDIKFDIIRGVKIEPIYHLINGIKNSGLHKLILECLKYNYQVDDYIPEYLIDKYKFIDKKSFYEKIHNPLNINDIKNAKLRGIYEEFFIFMFKMNYLKHQYDLDNRGLKRVVDKKLVYEFINKLPFNLTEDQLSSVDEIYNDLISDKRMNRLVLGDVGSGKTVVAEIGMYINYLAGYQSAMMAPTEILARQHYDNMINLFKDTNIKVGLLVGSLKKSEKDKVNKQLISGDIDIVVGTHALISDGVEFKNLGLVITDEQHRFGVNQRSNLQNKGIMSDILYMSATPIPRTYALTLYGDMDTSIIKSKPGGRKDIITKVKKMKDLKDVLYHMIEEIKDGHQVYVVAPLIEDEEGESNLNDVIKLKEKFDIAFNNKINTQILHGKMKQKDKDEIMEQFKNGEVKVLISTTVIEVGVDVKNSTMMVIFNAERFGLATLHQLRGRVGRNSLQSYCYLISDLDTPRLKVMEESNDGFYISEKDFELRGEGDLFGTRQSGDMSFKLGDIRRDFKILVQAKKDSEEFILNNIVDNYSSYQQYVNIIDSMKKLD